MSPPRDKSSSVVSLVLLEEESAVSSRRPGRPCPMSRPKQHQHGYVIQAELPDAWQLQQKCITHIVTPE